MPTVVDWITAAGLRAVGFRSRYVATRHGRVRLLEAEGRGPLPPVVVVHGLGSAAADAGAWMHTLRRDVSRVIAVDLPGHGDSDGVSDVSTFRDATIDALEAIPHPAIVFGNSLGGLVAIRWAQRRPERVRGLFLASPGGAPMAPDELDRFALRSHADARRFVDAMLGRPRWGHHVLAWGVRRRFANPVVPALLATAATEALAPSDLAGLAMPVWWMCGQQDGVFSASSREFFRASLPAHAVRDEPAGFGHAPLLDDGAAVRRRVVAFARSVAA